MGVCDRGFVCVFVLDAVREEGGGGMNRVEAPTWNIDPPTGDSSDTGRQREAEELTPGERNGSARVGAGDRWIVYRLKKDKTPSKIIFFKAYPPKSPLLDHPPGVRQE